MPSSYEALTFTSVGLDCSPTEHASIRWTHFRTAGFPQYGFKADISGGAFPLVLLLKPAPGIHSFFVSLLPPFVLIQTEAWYPALSRAGILSRYRHSSLTALPQGSSLQTGL